MPSRAVVACDGLGGQASPLPTCPSGGLPQSARGVTHCVLAGDEDGSCSRAPSSSRASAAQAAAARWWFGSRCNWRLDRAAKGPGRAKAGPYAMTVTSAVSFFTVQHAAGVMPGAPGHYRTLILAMSAAQAPNRSPKTGLASAMTSAWCLARRANSPRILSPVPRLGTQAPTCQPRTPGV